MHNITWSYYLVVVLPYIFVHRNLDTVVGQVHVMVTQITILSLSFLWLGLPKAGVPAVHTGRVTGGVPKGPDRPAPQPHPKDQDSLVQRAEHIPAGTRTPMCGHCNMVIRSAFPFRQSDVVLTHLQFF